VAEIYYTSFIASSSMPSLSVGKNGMIKFYQDWCGHCIRMKPDWDTLAKETELIPNVEIFDVNCGEQKELCAGVQGKYPKIKYFLDGAEKSYDGGRSLENLQDFVANTLSAKCDINKPSEGCSVKAIKFMDKWLKGGGDKAKIEGEVERLEGMMGKIMTADLKRWIKQRIDILSQGIAKLGGEL